MNINILNCYLNNKTTIENLFKDINLFQFLKSHNNSGAYSFTPYNTDLRYKFTDENFNKIKSDYQNNVLNKSQFLYLLNLIDLLIEGDTWYCKDSLKFDLEQIILNEELL